jgi:hypothetical protein
MATIFRMILNPHIHIADTERNITRKVLASRSINTQFTGAAVTLELRTVQQLQ